MQDIPLNPGDPAYDEIIEVGEGLDRLGDKPVLICWGEADFVFDLTFLAEWERRFPNAEVVRYPGAGHYVLEDEGADIIPRIVRFAASEGDRG